MPVVDVDAAIEKRSGKSIGQIIRVEGEDRFRDLESEELAHTLSTNAEVIAVGGGALLREANRILLSTEGIVLVQLAVSFKQALERLSADEESAARLGGEAQRPLIMNRKVGGKVDEGAIKQLWREREKLFQLAQVKVWTDFVPGCVVAEALHREARVGTRGVTVIPYCNDSREGGATGSVIIGRGVLHTLGARLEPMFPPPRKIAVVIDDGVYELFAESITKSIEGYEFELFRVPSGELSKNLMVVEEIAAEMLALQFSRDDLILVLGGGVVGDLGGLLASLYMRGVGLVQVPTTLVSQVDSALGGKTAVNLGGGKNILGTFYPADFVISDVELLMTLPEREFQSGLAEVVKYGFIASKEFFEWLEQNLEAVTQREPASLLHVVEFCSRTKLDIVCDDMHDRANRRALLNFGHTVGHAIEAITSYERYLHGEAVSIGCGVALEFGASLSKTPRAVAERGRKLLERCGLWSELPAELRQESEEKWSAAIKADKKRSGTQVKYVFLRDLGDAFVEDVEVETLVQFTVKSSRREV